MPVVLEDQASEVVAHSTIVVLARPSSRAALAEHFLCKYVTRICHAFGVESLNVVSVWIFVDHHVDRMFST